MSDIPSRALRDALRDRLAPPSSSGCVDAETLGAWSDGTLSRRDRATVEAHAAACARCQALLAVMAKTAPPLPARGWWQAATVRWLVPIGAVFVLAVAVWMNTPAQRLTAPAPTALEPTKESPRADAAAPAAQTTDQLAVDARARSQSAQVKASPVAPQPSPSSVAQSANASIPTLASGSTPASAPPPASGPAAAAREASASPRPQSEVRPEAPRALAETAIADRQAFKTALPATVEIASPDRNVRWRIVAGNSVRRSTDGGATWETQSTRAGMQLTAGAAPSTTICWAVGKAGAVWVSKDGQTWQHVEFPEAIDLVAVRATDGSSATVTAADGRVFNTTDGGQTWR